MSPTLSLLAQGVDDLITILIVILFIVIPAIAQFIAKMRAQKKPEAGAPGPAGRPARRPAGQPAEQAVDDEIGDFLRKATDRLGQKRQAAPRPAPPPIAAQAVGEQAIEAEVAAEEKPLGAQLRRHVGDYLDAEEFRQRADELGHEVGQADEQLAERLHGVFDHKLGRLADKPGESATPTAVFETKAPQAQMPATAAAGFTALLSDAQSIRRAIVINEILQRPEQRW